MTTKEIRLINNLNMSRITWQIVDFQVETDTFFLSASNEKIEGPFIYAYIPKEEIEFFIRIGQLSIGEENMKLVYLEEGPIIVIVYLLKNTDE